MFYKNFIKISLASLLGISVLCAEYGDFGFNDNPPQNEYYEPQQRSIPAKQVIIQNRKTITALKRRVSEMEERLAGLTSLIEGLNETIAEMQLSRSLSGPKGSNDDNTALIKELGVMIDKINASYVSKEELQKLLDGKKMTSSKRNSKKETISHSTDNESLTGKSTAKVYSEGVRLFVKHRYDEAKKRFTVTDTKGYKPAASNYYLGEIAYYTKQYEDAIFYYKKSVSLYDQASYIDVLLLHTAISLEKTGDKSQAKTFYKNIVDNYPDKKSAKIAKDKLKKLK